VTQRSSSEEAVADATSPPTSPTGGHTIVTKDVPQPLCVSHYYAGAGSIDRHNHLRQGRHPLALELAWDTKC
jgi:hypothetical protein